MGATYMDQVYHCVQAHSEEAYPAWDPGFAWFAVEPLSRRLITLLFFLSSSFHCSQSASSGNGYGKHAALLELLMV